MDYPCEFKSHSPHQKTQHRLSSVLCFFVPKMQALRRGKLKKTIDALTALGLGCQPCAVPKRQLLLSEPKP